MVASRLLFKCAFVHANNASSLACVYSCMLRSYKLGVSNFDVFARDVFLSFVRSFRSLEKLWSMAATLGNLDVCLERPNLIQIRLAGTLDLELPKIPEPARGAGGGILASACSPKPEIPSLKAPRHV